MNAAGGGPIMKKTRFTQKKIAYRNRFMRVYHTRADFGEARKDFYVVKFGRRGGIVAVKDGKILLVKQYRFLIDGLSIELPGGTIEEGEDLAEGTVRECLEETGIRCRNLRPLVVYYPGLDNVDNETTVFFTEDTEVAHPFAGNPLEVSEIVWLPLEHALALVGARRILDAMTVAGLFAYKIMRDGAPA